MKGVDIRTAQELLRHADIRMTLRYSHLSPSHLLDAVDLLDGTGTTTAAELPPPGRRGLVTEQRRVGRGDKGMAGRREGRIPHSSALSSPFGAPRCVG